MRAACSATSRLFVAVNSYTTGLSPSVMEYMLGDARASRWGGAHGQCDEIGLPVTATGGVRALRGHGAGGWHEYEGSSGHGTGKQKAWNRGKGKQQETEDARSRRCRHSAIPERAAHARRRTVRCSVKRGEYVAVLGANGCGKSTLAKHFNAILLPQAGTVYVEDMSTADEDKLFDIRQKVGMVFQNPDNQIVATVVEEDVAFALENLGVPPAEMRGACGRGHADGRDL